MNKQIKGLLLVSVLAVSTIAQAEQNTITSLPKALAVGFSSGFGAIVVPYPDISLAVLAMMSNAYDRGYNHLSKLEKVALNGSTITGAIAAIGVWYKAGQCMSNALWGTNIGRYIAIIPVVETALMAGLTYCLSKIEIRTPHFPPNSHSQNLTTPESVVEGA